MFGFLPTSTSLTTASARFYLDFSDPDDLGADRIKERQRLDPNGFGTNPGLNWTPMLFESAEPVNVNSTSTNINNAHEAFDGTTGGAANAPEGNWLIFRPEPPLQNVTRIRLRALANSVDVNGTREQDLPDIGGNLRDIDLGVTAAREITSICVRHPGGGGISTSLAQVFITQDGAETLLVSGDDVDYDVMADSPTQNWSVLNPLIDDSQLEDANLRLVSQTTTRANASSTATWNTTLDANHYYCEFTCIAQAPAGVGPTNIYGLCRRDQPDWFLKRSPIAWFFFL